MYAVGRRNGRSKCWVPWSGSGDRRKDGARRGRSGWLDQQQEDNRVAGL